MRGERYGRCAGIVAVLSAVWLLTACAATEQGDPNELVRQAVADIKQQQDFSFQGSSQVSVSGHTVLAADSFQGHKVGGDKLFIQAGHAAQQPVGEENELIPLNPLAQLEKLQQLGQQASWDAELSKGENKVIRVEARSEDVTRLIKQQLESQWQELSRNGEQLSAQNAQALPTEKGRQANAELQQFLQQSRERLDEMLASLSVNRRYHLWLGTGSAQAPKQMQITTDLRYKQDGEEKQESSVTTFQFDTMNAPSVISDSSS